VIVTLVVLVLAVVVAVCQMDAVAACDGVLGWGGAGAGARWAGQQQAQRPAYDVGESDEVADAGVVAGCGHG
jgi:hypothetical protein